MSVFRMTSRWGVQLEAEEVDLINLAKKINISISCPTSFFITVINEVYVMRTQGWDDAASSSDAFQLAVGDINLIRGCLDALDGCGDINLGTVYEFQADGSFIMSRDTKLTLRVLKPTKDLASPDEFRSLFARVASDDRLRTAFSDLKSDATWIDIYRSWESLKDFYGGEHKVHRAFNAEKLRIKQLSRTANSFRHVNTYDVVPNPMSLQEAKIYLKDLLLRAAASCSAPPAKDAFKAGQQVQLINLELGSGQATSLQKLSYAASSNED